MFLIADDVEKRLDTSNYEIKKQLLTGKDKNLIEMVKDELGGKIMTEFVALGPKALSYSIDDGSKD